MEKFDRRRKYYMILDCETATLPFTSEYNNAEDKKKIAIAKPLIYDIGYQIIDINGNIYKRVNYLISETFFDMQIFATAYYAAKRSIYLERLERGEITLARWDTFAAEFENDLKVVTATGAYNSMFDFKKAIPFTEKYVRAVYSGKYNTFINTEKRNCEHILRGGNNNNRCFKPDVFTFRDIDYPLFDVWGLACTHLLNNDDFRNFCKENNRVTSSAKYYSTTAETAYQFLMLDDNFEEAHCAIDDAEIESEIFALITKKTKHKFERGIIYFPFRIIGRADIDD